MRKKIIILGKNGFLGGALAQNAPASFDVIALGHDDVDVTDFEALRMKIAEHKPYCIINTVALAKTEECEKRVADAFVLNAVAALNVAKAAKECGAAVVQISTDYVFDGLDKVYDEEAVPNPINAYGISKYAGELAVQSYNQDHYIIRTSSLYGQSPNPKTDFPNLMIKLANEGKNIEVVDDIFMSPTNIASLSERIFALIDKDAPFGIYHIAGRGACSWYELVKMTFEIMGIKHEIKTVKAANQTVLTNRPLHIELKSKRLIEAGVAEMPAWEDDLRSYLEVKK